MQFKNSPKQKPVHMLPAPPPMPIPSHALIPIAALCALLATAALACDGGAADDAPATQSVRGQVLQVDARSLIELEALELLDGNGVAWRFEGRGIAIPGFAPSHLNEHKLLGQPIEVFYRREGDALVLRNITD